MQCTVHIDIMVDTRANSIMCTVKLFTALIDLCLLPTLSESFARDIS